MILALWQAVHQELTPQTVFDAFAICGSVVAIQAAKVYLSKKFGGVYSRCDSMAVEISGIKVELATINAKLSDLPEKVPSLSDRMTRIETAHEGRHADRRADVEAILDREFRQRGAE